VIPKKPLEQLRSEGRMTKILSKMEELDMEMTYSNFDKANAILYPGIYSRRKITSMLKHSPDFLSNLRDDVQVNHKIVKVEFVELDEPEAFYDLTVDSEYHNFALGSGIFVHNSGAASTKKSTKKSNSSGKKQNQDIITGMKVVKQLLHDPNSFVEDGTPKNLLMCMYNLFQKYGTNYMVHYEVIISCMMWADDDFWRLHEDRENVKTNYYSILKVPSMVSWLIGCAFSNVKTKLLDALTGYKVDHCSSLSKLFRL